MMRSLVLTMVCVSLVNGLNFQTGTSKVADSPKVEILPKSNLSDTHGHAAAHVFVINTADKVDKCHCISAQMAESKIPYSVSRQLAATPENMNKQCKKVPGLTGLNQRLGASKTGGEAALFCSNYLVWKEALANHADKDYIIIMEDDSFLKNKADFWHKVDDLLSSDCQGWDHINVDPYEGAKYRPGLIKKECPTFKLMNPTVSGGAHMQIIKRNKLEKLIQHVEEHGAKIVDDAHAWMPKSMRKFSWKAGIVQQFNAKYHSKVQSSLMPAYCTKDVYKHQVTMRQTFGEKAPSSDLAFKEKSGMKLAFNCEN